MEVHQGPPRPDQRSAYRENISLVAQGGGQLGGSWSELLSLSYTSSLQQGGGNLK